MEEFSVLRTPAYAKYNGVLDSPTYSSRYGYTLAYYEPIYDIDLKIPGLRIAERPFVPIQHIKRNRGTRPFVPRHLTEEDMIQINLRAQMKARDILEDFHPAQKASYESARDFRTKKEIESKIEDIREACASANDYYRRAEKYDFTRQNLFNPRTKKRFEKTHSDIILDAKVENLKEIESNLGEDRFNHKSRFKLLSSGCKPDKAVGPDENQEDVSIEANASSTSGRRSSRETRAEQLKQLQARFKKQESESDCFERTFGRHLAKLRGDVSALSTAADDFIADNRFQTFKIDRIFKST